MRRNIFAIILVAFSLAACQGVQTKAEYPDRRQPGDKDAVYTGQREGIFGKGGLNLFGGKKEPAPASGITVNAYLWRAALDTVSFMPIATADPFGGTILTDWYTAPDAPGERVKANIFILDRELRTDALKVTLFRQVASQGYWENAAVDSKTVTGLEDAILTRARQLKVGQQEAE